MQETSIHYAYQWQESTQEPIGLIPDNAQFVSDSQDVQPVRDELGNHCNPDRFEAFFVIAEDGEYKTIWGIHSIIPRTDDDAVKFVVKQYVRVIRN